MDRCGLFKIIGGADPFIRDGSREKSSMIVMQVTRLPWESQANKERNHHHPLTYQKNADSCPSDLSPSATYSADPPKIALATA